MAANRLTSVAAALRSGVPAPSTQPAAAEAPVELEVPTAAGMVRGAARGDGSRAFFGIPFASVERWQPPLPAEPWPGVRDATAIGPACPQSEHPVPGFAASGPQDETDCLNLNVFCPPSAGDGKPIMLWIHVSA